MAISIRSLAVTMLLVAVSGCAPGSKLKTVPVSGKVTFKGNPVSDATVTFMPPGETGQAVHAASAMTDAQGVYKLVTMETPTKPLDGVPPGKYDVTVTKFAGAGAVDAARAAKKMTPDAMKDMSPEELKAMAGQKGGIPAAPSEGGEANSAAWKESQPKSELPERYGDPKQSGLTFDVKAGGPQTYDIPLTEE
jgi:hypothetical protein